MDHFISVAQRVLRVLLFGDTADVGRCMFGATTLTSLVLLLPSAGHPTAVSEAPQMP